MRLNLTYMLERVVWTPEYSVGVAEIDEQHQKFIDIINELSELSRKTNLSREQLQGGLNRMGNYGFYHLGTEEAYFVKCGYAGAKEHVAAHNAYRQTVAGLLARSEKAGEDLNKLIGDAAAYSGKWLLGHILTVDKKYTDAFHKCGLK